MVTDILQDVKARDDFCKNAMFSNAKLRLLMSTVGFERLGLEDVPGASWVVPAALASKELRETVSSINKALLSPVSEGNDDDPRQLLRRKQTGSARTSGVHGPLDVNFGSDSEGEDTVPDGLLFPPNPRSKSNVLDELKKKRKKKRKGDTEQEPLDDEALEARRESRLSNALARQAKIKSDLFIHASDEESDEEADREFFRLEEERRLKQAENVKKAILTGSLEKASKGKKASVRKRKSDMDIFTTAAESKRRRRGSNSAGSEAGSDADGDILMAGLDAQSPGSRQISTRHGAQDEEDTPLTSAEDDLNFDDDLIFNRDRRSKTTTAENDIDPDEEDTPVAPSRRRTRGGFVIDSDSE